jgi:hypothetical protein
MAIASAPCKTISRGGGRSATAAAAYRTGEKVPDQRTGETHDYRRRGGVDHVSMHLPEGVPTMTTAELWNKAEAAEVRRDAVVARELLVALPHELTQFQRRELSVRMAEQLVARYQVAAQVAVHLPEAVRPSHPEASKGGDSRNHHVHIMFTVRRMDASGALGGKTRELDAHGKKEKALGLHGPDEISWMRSMVEAETNAALEQAGSSARIDMRSLAAQHAEAVAQGDRVKAALTDRPPTVHLGPRVTAIVRECAKAKREPLGLCDRIAEARAMNMQREHAQLNAQIIDIEQAREARAAREAAAAEAKLEAAQRAERQRAERHRESLIKASPQLQAAERDVQAALASVERDVELQAKHKIERDTRSGEAATCRAEAQQWIKAHPFRAWLGMDQPARLLNVKAAGHEAAAAEHEASRVEAKESAEQNRFEARLSEGMLNKGIEAAQRPPEPEPPVQAVSAMEPEPEKWVVYDEDGSTFRYSTYDRDTLYQLDKETNDWHLVEPEPKPHSGPSLR